MGNKSGTNQGGGNPINLITGNKYQREDDLPALPGVLGLEIVRHYNSAYSNINTTTGLLGRGWKLSYETDLYAVGNTVQIIQADGTRIIFNRDPGNRSLCSTSNPADGALRIDATSRGNEYVWSWANGRVLSFNSIGKLVQIADPTGEFVSLQHDHKGMLMQVTDPQGRQLKLHYPTSKQSAGESGFRGVMAIDSPAGRYQYAYGSALPGGSTAPKTSVLANLVKVVYPGESGSRLYHYEDVRRPTFLTGISVAKSRAEVGGKSGVDFSLLRTSTYLYGIDGKAILSVRGMPARLQTDSQGKPLKPARLQDNTGIGQITLDHSAAGRTVLTNSLGQTSIYRYAIVNDQYRLLEVRGAGCNECGESNVRYGYDKSGRLTEKTRLYPDGEPVDAVRTELDNDGRTLGESAVTYIAGMAQPPQWRTRFAYPSPNVLLVSRPSVVPGREVQTRMTSNAKGQLLSVVEAGWSPGVGTPSIGASGIGTNSNDKNSGSEPTALSRTTTYRYKTVNGRSVLAEIDGPLANGAGNNPADSDITRLTWDERGSFVTTIAQPGGASSQIQHDQAGRVAFVRNKQGLASSFAYHPLGMLQRVTQMDTQGNIVTQRSISHDVLGRAIESGSGVPGTPGYRAEQRQAFNTADQLLWQAQTDGMLRQASYDTESHLTQVIAQGAGQRQQERYVYDTQSRIVQVANANGATQRITYDPASSRALALTDAMGRTRRLAVSAQSASTTNTNAEANTETATKMVTASIVKVARDDFGREVALTTASHGRTVQLYDAADRLVSRIDAKGESTLLQYDVQGRLIERRVQGLSEPISGAIVTTWRYAASRLLEVRHPGQIERFAYDARGQQISKAVELETASAVVAAAASTGITTVTSIVTSTTRTRYQADGSLASHSLPDGSWLHYERDGQGQIVALYRQASTWLPWGWNRTTLISGLQRDLVGLSGATFGNGIRAHWQRSAEGAVLARVAYTRPGGTPTTTPTTMPTTSGHTAPTTKPSPTLPGALGLPTDLHALFDARLLYDTAGNVLLQSQHGAGVQRTQAYAYDGQDQLIAAQRSDAAKVPQASAPAPAVSVAPAVGTPMLSGGDQVWRYAYDAYANRILAQEGVAPREMGRTRRVRYNLGSGMQPFAERPGAGDGNSLALGDTTSPRTYIWGAMCQLQRIERSGQKVARYRYDARGLRVSKVTKAGIMHYLYDQERQRVADLDAQGRILRQYVWVDGKLLATIDPAEPRQMAAPAEGAMEQLLQTAQVLWRGLRGQEDRITYVHGNHLGAPIAATDAQGQIAWQADHAPYGKLIQGSAGKPGGQRIAKASAAGNSYQLDLRLPGQWEDAESGLYYNDARYYDPEAGRYLIADPLGHLAERLGSTNAYAYVNNNPASYVDPLGLILFAFDGTGNSDNINDPAMKGGGLSNIRRFYDAYDDGSTNYVSGVGTVHRDRENGDIVPDTYARNTRLALATPSTPLFYNDMGGNYSGPARIDRMVKYIEAEANTAVDTDSMQIDIIGFSRGAAQAREFANRIVSQTKNGAFNYTGTDGKAKCQMVTFRFMGLFDTVLSTNYSDFTNYRSGIPDQFAHVAQAVALNEYRGDVLGDWIVRNPQPYSQHYGAFPLESIGASSNAAGKLRIERGFIGAHADIGGGYAESEGQLSLVALNWMVRQAQDAGVKLKNIKPLPIGTPVLHDQSTAIMLNSPSGPENFRIGLPGIVVSAEDRVVKGAASGSTQRTMGFGNESMRYSDTQAYIGYTPRDINQRDRGSALDPRLLGNKTGTVDMEGYLDWLRQHNYCFIGDTDGSCKRDEVKR